MIRRVAAVLLAANLAFWGWAHWFRGEQTVAAPAPPSGQSTGPQSAAPPAKGAVATPIAADELLQDCIRLTGFASASALDAAAARLAVGNLTIKTDAGGSDGAGKTDAAPGQPAGYWVHVSGLGDARAQRELIDRLRSAGLADTYAMPADPEFRVSVGLFSDPDRARQRVEQLRALGIESTVQSRGRSNASERWLELRGTLPADITAQVIQGWGLDPGQINLSPCQP